MWTALLNSTLLAGNVVPFALQIAKMVNLNQPIHGICILDKRPSDRYYKVSPPHSGVRNKGEALESVNSAPPLGSGPLPSRRRKATGEFLNALNLLADSYIKTVKAPRQADRSACALALVSCSADEKHP